MTSGWRGLGAVVVVASGIAVAACSDDDVDLGGGTAPAPESPTGTWTGYIEQYETPLGSDAVRLELVVDGSRVTGTFDVGNAAAPPAPTDPEGPYLEEVWSRAFNDPRAADPRVLGVILGDGHRYPLLEGAMTDGRLRAALRTDDTMSAWCGLQRAFNVNPEGSLPSYRCLPSGGIDRARDGSPWWTLRAEDGAEVRVHAFKVGACGVYADPVFGQCSCTATGCGLPEPGQLPSGLTVRLDLAVSDDTLTGSLGIGPTVRNLRLRRQRP